MGGQLGQGYGAGVGAGQQGGGAASRDYGYGDYGGYGGGVGGYGGGGYEDQLVLLRPPPSRRNQGGLGQISDLVDIDYETLVMLISTHIYADIY